MGLSCFAYQEHSGKIDIDSIAEHEGVVRLKCLEGSMGWRFERPERYDQDVEWARLLTFGKVVPVIVMTRHSSGSDGVFSALSPGTLQEG